MNLTKTPTCEPWPKVKRQIFEKFLKRIRHWDIATDVGDEESFYHFNPDVIVIRRDQTTIFEAQNERASAVLRRKCSWETETIRQRERIQVHPLKSRTLIEALSAAGLKVAC